jgi:phenylalanyl-tRNA synthetase beta chain
MSHLRSSLIPGLVKNVDFNYKNSKKDIMLFEYGNTFSKNGSGLKNFNEKLLLSGVIFGNISEKTIHQEIPLKSDFLAIKGLISSFINSLDLGHFSEVSNLKQNNVFDICHQLKINKTTIGSFGKISSKIIDQLDVANLSIYGFELELDRVLKSINELERTFKPINYLPKVERDINFVVDEPVLVGDIVDLISKHKFANLIKIEPLNIFRDKSLGDNKKSITLNFHFQHTSKTLEDKDVNLVINEIIKVVSKNYGAKLR